MGLLGELRRWWEERSYPCHLDFAAVSEQTRDCQRQEEAVTFCRQRWDWPCPCHGDEFQSPVVRLACSSKKDCHTFRDSFQWFVCVLLHLPHSGIALQSNLAQHSFPSRRSRWQGCGSVGWSAKTLNKLLKECRANTAFSTCSGGPRAKGTSCCRGATRRSPCLRQSEPSELARAHGVHGDTLRAWALCTRRRDPASRQTVHSLDTFRNERCISHS